MYDLFMLERFAEGFHVKNVYIDISEDLIAGILLGQIVYWYKPNERGEMKVTIERDGKLWLAKTRDEWHEEIRITGTQFDLARKKLERLGYIEAKKFKFKGAPTIHIHLKQENVEKAVQDWILMNHENGFSGNMKMKLPETSNSILTKHENESSRNMENYYTEITTEITTETTAENKEPAAAPFRQNIASCYLEAYGKMMSPIQTMKLQAYIDEDGFETAVVCKAIEEGALNNAGINYIEAILKRLEREGIKTIDQYEEHEKKRREQNGKARGNHGASKDSGSRSGSSSFVPDASRFASVDISEYE